MSEGKNMREDDNEKGSDNNPWARSNGQYEEKGEGMRLWGIFLFSLIGATVTTFAVGQFRRTAGWFYTQAKLIKYVTSLKKFARSQSSRNGATGSSFRSSFQEEAWKRYNRRMQEEYEEEMERVERIKRMQSVFNRERNKYKRSYESWRENGEGPYHQHFQRDDWYWKTDTSYKYQRANAREIPRDRTSASYPLSHHYLTLGLDRTRAKPYTEAEIKNAFRAKAMEFHPDQNQDNKEAAEAKFKEVMTSYEAIKLERKNGSS